MRMLALKEVEVIKPPFKSTVKDLVDWVAPTTVSLRGEIMVGGLLMCERLILTTGAFIQDSVEVKLPNRDYGVEGAKVPYDSDLFLSCYAVHEDCAIANWVGLPNRNCPINQDTYLFSVCPMKTDLVVRYRAIPIPQSKAFQKRDESETGNLEINEFEREKTYPVVDQFGYLVGINVGGSEGEVMCQIVTPNGSKL
jgi:hypothetical protein